MGMTQKSGEERGRRRRLGVGKGRGVLVAVKVSKDIPRDALVWALTHIVLPGDFVKLLVVIPDPSNSSKKLWGLERFGSDCKSGNPILSSGTPQDQKDYITESCAQIVLQLNHLFDPDKVRMKIKVIPGSDYGTVAAQAKKTRAHWVVLDKKMRKEATICMEELECNVVMMKNSHPKVLRLNLLGSPSADNGNVSGSETSRANVGEEDYADSRNETPGQTVTPVSSPEDQSSSTTSDAARVSSFSVNISEINWDLKKGGVSRYPFEDESDSDTDSENLSSSPSTTLSSKQWTSDTTVSSQRSSTNNFLSFRVKEDAQVKFFKPDIEFKSGGVKDGRRSSELSKNMRNMISSLSKKALPEPPPLCSICHHKAPVFGKPPRWFTFTELETATRGFCEENFLAEGGYGSVYRGILPDGQYVAVKQYKSASSQGDHEFCSEVEVLSCAQHRNVVLLIGFCVEEGKRLLVYEYICNGSLDAHLYGCKQRDPLSWSARQKVATGAARGLRYLHEECRVGCIVHRDLRPNNILLTHDFEPMVGDFGLARWQPDGDLGVETRIIGRFGYLAPEYAQSGQITEKADIYSFGVVLVELITGRKAMDIKRPRGQQSLTEWARPLLQKNAMADLLDPFLSSCYVEEEVSSMMRCASLCIQRDPLSRPRMSQVLRMLERDT
ncbi:unnamed protein product [Cuscuta epithymum]|uniref:Protein kinase domain-containing protein n=1 Tax=Cuscuta epithymum TaxID=186058 RepID=A0AAV0DLS8_9ASTE|nr:unnamed protein product [Cuscuta epithymum]